MAVTREQVLQLVELYDSLDPNINEVLYRTLLARRVRDDATLRMASAWDETRRLTAAQITTVLNNVVERYVWNGDYDISLNYQKQLDALIKDELSNNIINI